MSGNLFIITAASGAGKTSLVRALLATEDQRFFEHPGVDVFGLGRAALKMIQTENVPGCTLNTT
ncbi:MAG: hypothetical protein EBU69_02460 [Methylophilaceae bacterium]|nr:hypothetical protein [Methylophilaceae bacterium]